MGYRVRVFTAAFREICRFAKVKVEDSICLNTAGNSTCVAKNNVSASKSKNKLARQLTLTQKNLLRWTLSEYKEESQILLQKYRAG